MRAAIDSGLRMGCEFLNFLRVFLREMPTLQMSEQQINGRNEARNGLHITQIIQHNRTEAEFECELTAFSRWVGFFSKHRHDMCSGEMNEPGAVLVNRFNPRVFGS